MIRLKNKSFIVLILSTFIIHLQQLHSQQAPGLFYENYSGIHGVIKNPSAGQHGLLSWDFNIASVNAYFQNDYVYAKESNLFNFISGLDSLSVIGQNEQINDPNAQGYLFYEEERIKRGIANLDLMGPSVWINFHPISLGLFTRLRSETNTPNIPSELGYYQYQEIPFDESQSIADIQSSGAVWSEIGLNISTNELWNDESFSLGINLKYLRPHEGYYVFTTGDVNFTKTADNQLILDNSVGTIALTDGLATTENFAISKKGHGWSFDIGLNKKFERLKLGASILDIGKIKFNNAAELHRIVVNDPLSIDIDQIVAQSNFDGILGVLNESITSGTSADSILVATDFSLGMPMKLLLNLDYQLSNKTFINASVVQNLSTSHNAIRAENNVSISPRYESRWFTIATPLIISNYETVRLGLATRLGLLTIGSDDILSLFGSSDFNGSSIYAAIKINPFRQGYNKGNKVKCPKVKRSPFDSADPIKGAKRMKSPGNNN